MAPTKVIDCGLTMGDASAPIMMRGTVAVGHESARIFGFRLNFIDAPAGWVAHRQFGDTLPRETVDLFLKVGYLLFGGVGDPKLDKTLGKQFPEMSPEARALLILRKEAGLLLNFRPAEFPWLLKDVSNMKSKHYREGELLKWHFVRFLLQDEYFGTIDLLDKIPGLRWVAKALGLKPKNEVTGKERRIWDAAYYDADMLERYFRGVYEYARMTGLPVTPVTKSNICGRYKLWPEAWIKVHREFLDVKLLAEIYVDRLNAELWQNPWLVFGILAMGNAHGDIVSDGGLAATGSMGMMHSTAVNPITGACMAESGAGTAPGLEGKANPLGRILTLSMLLEHVGTRESYQPALDAAAAIRRAVDKALKEGCLTADLIDRSKEPDRRALSTDEMAQAVIDRLAA